MTELELRIVDLLRADQNCQGNVLNTTVHEIARMLQPAPDSADAIEERSACAAAMIAVRDRMQSISCHDIDGLTLVDGAAFLIERRRLCNAIESVQLGLHRKDGAR